jgi:hypothetical protein
MPLSRHSLEPQQAKRERNLETFLIQFGETFDSTRPAAKWFFDPCTVANRLITTRSPARFALGPPYLWCKQMNSAVLVPSSRAFLYPDSLTYFWPSRRWWPLRSRYRPEDVIAGRAAWPGRPGRTCCPARCRAPRPPLGRRRTAPGCCPFRPSPKPWPGSRT